MLGYWITANERGLRLVARDVAAHCVPQSFQNWRGMLMCRPRIFITYMCPHAKLSAYQHLQHPTSPTHAIFGGTDLKPCSLRRVFKLT